MILIHECHVQWALARISTKLSKEHFRPCFWYLVIKSFKPITACSLNPDTSQASKFWFLSLPNFTKGRTICFCCKSSKLAMKKLPIALFKNRLYPILQKLIKYISVVNNSYRPFLNVRFTKFIATIIPIAFAQSHQSLCCSHTVC